MDNPLVSIIVPVYNTESFLNECLESLVNQTYKNVEIICVNDGSTDKSEEILDYYEYMYSARVNVYHKENGGLSSARNYGLSKAHGDLIMFVDSDDILVSTTIEKSVEQFKKNKELELYIFGIKQFSKEGVFQDIVNTNAWFERRMQPNGLQIMTFDRALNSNIHVCNKVFKKELIGDIRFIPGLLYEDVYFMWRIFLKATTVYYEPDIGYLYRVHSNSIMEKSYANKDFTRALHHLYNWHKLFEYFKSIRQVSLVGDKLSVLLDSLGKRTLELSNDYEEDVVYEYIKMYRSMLVSAIEQEIKIVVSVIVPVYNSEKYLNECLDSLVNQTLGNIEIICVDDASTDSSPQILDEYASKYSNVRVFHKCKEGVAAARNFGIKAARGETIAFVDSDDYVDSTLFEKAYSKYIESNVDLLIYGAKPFKNKDEQTEQNVEDFINWLKCPYKGSMYFDFEKAKASVQCVWNKLYSVDLLKNNVNFKNGLLHEDISFVWLCYFSVNTVYYLDEQLYFYRIHANSVMDETLKEKTYTIAKAQLENVEYIIDELFRTDEIAQNMTQVQFLLDRHTRRALRECPDNEQHKIHAYSNMLNRKFQDILSLYKGDFV